MEAELLAVGRMVSRLPYRVLVTLPRSAFPRSGGPATPRYIVRDSVSALSKRRFTRLTNAFSKKLENHEHMLAIYFMFYNFCRVHQSLRVSPAMQAGLAHTLWTIEDMVKLMEPKSILEGLLQAA